MTRLNLIIAGLLIGIALLAELFHAVPMVDLWVSRALYVEGEGFPWQHTALGHFIDDDMRRLMTVAVALFAIDAIRGWLGRRTLLGLSGRGYLFVLLSVLVSAGLVANAMLKEHSGRARPKDIAGFGGGAVYTAPLTLADQCARNCSTVAGDAAFAFNALALALLARRRRALWIGGALGVGTLAGVARVMQGKHFFTDALFGGLLTVLVVLVLYRLMLDGRDPSPPIRD